MGHRFVSTSSTTPHNVRFQSNGEDWEFEAAEPWLAFTLDGVPGIGISDMGFEDGFVYVEIEFTGSVGDGSTWAFDPALADIDSVDGLPFLPGAGIVGE